MAKTTMSLQVLSLRYALVSIVFLGLTGIEGLFMRTQLSNLSYSIPSVLTVPMAPEHFYAMLTAHPLVGAYGWAYLAVFSAFYYLVPTLIKKPLYSIRLANGHMWMHIIGLLTVWSAGYFLKFGALYTAYWPLPVARFAPISVVVFAVGLALVELSVLCFIFNIFATVLRRSMSNPLTGGVALLSLLMASFGLDRLIAISQVQAMSGSIRGLFGGSAALNGGAQTTKSEEPLPVFVVAVMRGSIDAVLNAVVLAGAGILMLAFALPTLLTGVILNPLTVDALVYKNVFWWGLDMIADGDVLIWVAGTLYLLAPILANRPLYGEKVVRYVILTDLIVSMGVWSHHLLSDRPQPDLLRLISGQFITWGEFFTMGLSFFAVLMTLWLARPVKLSMPMKFMLGGIMGFALGGASGLLQANYAVNLIMHNTQWVPGFHIHEMLLTGLSNILFAAIYALLPMLTGTALKSERLGNLHFWLWTIGGVGMAFSMGLAWRDGMLRRTLYPGVTMYLPYMNGALFFGIVLALGFLAFLANLIHTYGLRTLIGLFIPGVAKKASTGNAMQSDT
jgi:cytochrome c oxidase subunit 1